MIINDLAIVGGGTAGLITALILKKTYPNLKIDIIESDKIGIVGVGEGSTEHWRDFMLECNIDISELIKETDATFKYGINFVNWHGDNTNYIHTVSSAFSWESVTHSKVMLAYLIANGAEPKDIVHSYVEKSLHRMPFWGINQFHFDTFKLNNYLHKLCEDRNINIIKAEIEQVVLDDAGNIDNLISNQQENFSYDFYVDSTGFHRLLLEKTMGIKWKSYQKHLPMNAAIAFPTEYTTDIPSWTLSKALKNGWNWRIPTQNRYGNGYVFCDQFTTFDQAKEEIEEIYGHNVQIGKQIKFDAGHSEKFWHNNCAGIGLATSFVEPLEASSIGSSIQQAKLFALLIQSYIPKSQNSIPEKTFNRASEELITNILEFVALHYITKREDSNFWKETKNLALPSGLEEKLKLYKHKMPSASEFENRDLMFKESNWILVMHGLGLIDKSAAQRTMDMQPTYLLETISINSKNLHDLGGMVSHREALQWLMDNPEQR